MTRSAEPTDAEPAAASGAAEGHAEQPPTAGTNPEDEGAGARKRHPSPGRQLLIFGGVFVGSFALLSQGTGTHEVLSTTEWLVWRAVASLSTAVAAVLAYRAVWALRRLPPLVRAVAVQPRPAWLEKLAVRTRERAQAPPAGRTTRSGRLLERVRRIPRYARGRHALTAVTALVVVLVFLAMTVPRREWPIELMSLRLTAVVWFVGASAVPWLLLLLLTQSALRSWKDDKDHHLGPLLQLWDALVSCITAFVAFVTLSLVPTGALRSLWLAQGGKESEFPAGDVLLFGGFFAVVLGAITLPALALWRSVARGVVDKAWPVPDGRSISEEWVGQRSRLETLLHLDIGLIASPLTAFSVLTPLVTAALAAFVPQLGQ